MEPLAEPGLALGGTSFGSPTAGLPIFTLGLLPHFPGVYPPLALQETMNRGALLSPHVSKRLDRIDSLRAYRISKSFSPRILKTLFYPIQSIHEVLTEKPEAILILCLHASQTWADIRARGQGLLPAG